MEFILVPGAWAGGWLWDEVAQELRKKGHETHQLTLSGLDGKSDPGDVRLKTHVEDVRSYIASRDLHSVVLVGHSYSGFVVGQAASQHPALIDHTIFVEAFLPVAGRSLLEVSWAAAGFDDTDLSFLSFLELYGTEIAERRMPARRVVEALDVVEHI